MKIVKHTNSPLDLFLSDFRVGSIDKFLDDMDKQFQSFMNWDYPIKGKILSAGFPRTDIVYNDTENSVDYICDIPGWNKDDIDITILDESNCFKISGKKSEERKLTGQMLLHERKSTGFQRTFPLPLADEIDVSKEISAKFENGQLFISVPMIIKTLPVEPKKLKIEIK